MGTNPKIQMAHDLHAKGLNDREIGERLGVGTAAVWKWRHPERAKELSRRSEARPERKAAKRAWDRANVQPCSQCGKPTSYVRGQGKSAPKRCAACYADEVAAFRQAVVEGYRASKLPGQIAVETGRSVSQVKTEASRLRQAGVEVPQARRGPVPS